MRQEFRYSALEQEKQRRLARKARRRKQAVRRARRRFTGIIVVGIWGMIIAANLKVPMMKERAEAAPEVEDMFSSELLFEGTIPESLQELYERNPEARQFVLDYPEWSGHTDSIDLEEELEAADGGIPHFLQWDERWGYEQYGDDFLAITGCGPTCLSMVYVGLTGDTVRNPLEMAKLAEREGYYVSGSGSAWSMMTGLAQELGLQVKEIGLDERIIKETLREGNPIICIMGPGDFTATGHFIVLESLSEDDGIVIRDPNSVQNTEKIWEYEELEGQIRNLWRFGL